VYVMESVSRMWRFFWVPFGVAVLFCGCGGSGSTTLPHGAGSPAAGSTPVASASPAGTAAVTFNDWPTYGYDNARDGFNPNTTAFTDASIAALHLAWQDALAGEFNTQSQPIVATEIPGHAALLFTAGGTGNVYALDGLTGAQVWKTQLPQSSYFCSTGGATFPMGVGGSAAYDPATKSLYIADSSNVVANGPTQDFIFHLNAVGGAVINNVDVAPSPFPGEINYAHTSITLAAGMLYAGTSSVCDVPYWRGRVAAVNEATMTLAGTFFTTYNQNGAGTVDGGGVWGWGGVSTDGAGNVYVGVGNADNNTPLGTPSPQFTLAPSEFVGYGEHVVKLTSNAAVVEDSNYPGFSFGGNSADLDLAGTPVLHQPGVGCDLHSASMGKSGQLVIYDTAHMATGPIADLQLSQSNFNGAYISNAGFSPITGWLYAPVASATGTLDPPGLVAISGCATPAIVKNAVFGPDSYAYAATPPRSAPTVTAGGVIFTATPCTPNASGGCGAASDGDLQGALWALDATTLTVLNGGLPLLITGDNIRMAPVVDGNWLWVIDNSGNVYGLTTNPSVPKIAARRAQRSSLSRYHGNVHT
jgi:hypothetical protein